MAETMKEIRRRMKTVENTEHITGAMGLVSAAKFRRAKLWYDQAGRQILRIAGLMEEILSEHSGATEVMAEAPLAEADGAETPAVTVVFTGSRGLCGSYNSSLLKLAASRPAPSAALAAIGSRGAEFYRRRGAELAAAYEKPLEDMTAEEAGALAEVILQEWRKRGETEVLLVRMRYINTLKQEGAAERILPVRKGEAMRPDLEFLPSKEAVLDFLLPKYLQLSLYQAALESAVCEHAARRTAMESAADSAKDMMAALTLKHNRARQQAVTEELIEIVSGSEVLK